MAKNRFVNLLHYFGKNLMTMIGIVMIWRGVWILLDIADNLLFKGSNYLTAIGGVIAGLLLLYLPDKDLDEIKKL